jgi:hypothetical protein
VFWPSDREGHLGVFDFHRPVTPDDKVVMFEDIVFGP